MAYAEFIAGSDYEQSSGPIISRQFAVTDLWPVGLHGKCDGSACDILEAGQHPVVAVGPNVANGTKSSRPVNLTGVVTSYTNDYLVTLNLADKVVVRAYVANVTAYPATFDTSMAIGEPVYVDDSHELGDGCTLSRSPHNSDGADNPLAGYLYYCQDEFYDRGVGGAGQTATWPKTVDNSLVEAEYCVMLVNDYGKPI